MMPIEILMLASTVGLVGVLILVNGTYYFSFLGLPAQGGLGAVPNACHAWHCRLSRSIRTTLLSTLIFAPVVLLLHFLGLHSGQSVFGSQLFFTARLFHVLLSLADERYALPGAEFVSYVGVAMTVSILFY